MSNNVDNKVMAVRACLAMFIIGVLAIVALSKNFDGEILKIAIFAISVLGGSDILLEYYYKNKVSK